MLGKSHQLVEKARSFAIEAHSRIDHRRKYSNEPYGVHLEAVANLVAEVSSDPDVISAAWLHDAVEDTGVMLECIESEFGKGVKQLVFEMTDVSKPDDGNRECRKRKDLEHLASASDDAMTIKLADLIDNARSITRHDPKFSKVYMREMKALLQVLRNGDGHLWKVAASIVKDYYE